MTSSGGQQGAFPQTGATELDKPRIASLGSCRADPNHFLDAIRRPCASGSLHRGLGGDWRGAVLATLAIELVLLGLTVSASLPAQGQNARHRRVARMQQREA